MIESKHWRTKDRVGEIYTTNEGCEIEIVQYFSNKNSHIRFKDSDVIFTNIEFGNILKGTVKNPYHPSVHGVGYIGIGHYKISIGRKLTKTYCIWNDMLRRCYSDKALKTRPTYADCSVDERWHNFQVFAEWFEGNYVDDGRHLDKDILFKGNKVYSEETCCFVPAEINTLFIKSNKVRGFLPIGVSRKGNRFQAQINRDGLNEFLGYFDTPEEAFQAYKTAKEAYIKEIAMKWRDKIPNKVFEAMIYYEVEITD